METTDKSIIDGLKREKDEEVGKDFKINIFPDFTTNLLFTKKDGNAMILPHYFAVHDEGDIELSEEYSEFKWVPLAEIESFEPKIPTIPEILKKFAILKNTIPKSDRVQI